MSVSYVYVHTRAFSSATHTNTPAGLRFIVCFAVSLIYSISWVVIASTTWVCSGCAQGWTGVHSRALARSISGEGSIYLYRYMGSFPRFHTIVLCSLESIFNARPSA